MRAAGFALIVLVAAGCASPDESAAVTPPTGDTMPPSPPPAPTPSPAAVPPRPTWTPGDWADAACTAPAASSSPPAFVLSSEDALRSFAWNGTGYHATASAPPVDLLSGDGRLLVATTNHRWGTSRVTVLDADLRATASRDLPEVGSLAVADGVIWVATKWNLTSYDATLHELGRVRVPVPPNPPSAKLLDRVDIRDGVAYVVDDVIFPYHVFRFDVRSSTLPKLLGQATVSGKPVHQWVGDGEWYVQGGFGGQYGSSSWFVMVQEDGNTWPPRGSFGSTSWRMEPGALRIVESTGYAVQSGEASLPAWSIRSGNGTTELGRLAFEADNGTRSLRPVWSCTLGLESRANLGIILGHAILIRDEGFDAIRLGPQPTLLARHAVPGLKPIDGMGDEVVLGARTL